MATAATHKLVPLVSLALLIACGTDSGDQRVVGIQGIQAHSFKNSEWSEPVNLSAPINTELPENSPAFSPDELRLYFASDRPGGVGDRDLWVSRRGCRTCPWEAPVNLGPVINSPQQDASVELSNDGHLLFFHSNRPGGHGSDDIYVSRRANPKDDFGWGPPVNLGPLVNTEFGEGQVDYLQSAEDGAVNLYFTRGQPVSAGDNGFDIYQVPVTREGEPTGPAVPVAELSVPGFGDARPTVRADGREVFFWSNRPGGLGRFDLWTATRRSVRDPWSTPENVGAPLNSDRSDFIPELSHDGRTLLFVSNRPGGVGRGDIWISTRTPSGKEEP